MGDKGDTCVQPCTCQNTMNFSLSVVIRSLMYVVTKGRILGKGGTLHVDCITSDVNVTQEDVNKTQYQ